MTASVRHDESRDKGFALVLVLWALLLLSVLASSFLLEARAGKTIANTVVLQLKGRMLADGAINRAILSLLDPRDPLRLPLDGTFREIDFLGERVALSCESEAGKIDLNAASLQQLRSIFQAQGLSTGEAEFIARQIEVWRSPVRNSPVESLVALYTEAGRTYGPRFAPFRSVDELRLVIGMNDALHAAVAPFMTVWSSSGTVDLSVANDALLRVLAAGSDSFASTQLAARQNGNAAGAARVAAVGEALTIVATAEFPDITVRRSASIQISGDRGEPYRVLAWQ
ncbi:type II secretion system protein GspK [Bradyrhizobium sp. SSUT112]|uniref:general secretion pathway protein GspK n=1 Tax=Bradyrhizobium sp. SSUT112 TaxID=3040604 RepID=UPI00244B0E80|nr:type II secretion system protein GspK [Bradyrhizobium sp. SSUT112]MDH2352288.1 type II secretion system protein GspK [Bradyrhizobium sp. SSUT112]